MLELFGSVVGVLGMAAGVVRNLEDIGSGVRRVVDFAGDILGVFRKKVPDERQQQVVIRAALAQAAAMPQAEFDRKAEEIVQAVLSDKSAEEKKAASEYLKLWPERIRTTFMRPEDPTGTSAPPRWVAGRAEDIAPVIPPRPPMFHAGDPVPDNNRWKLDQRLGIGGFGEVWRARNREDDFSVFKFCLDPASQERMFTHERKIIKLVKAELDDHPNIVKLMDSHLEGATPWLQYEFAPGGDLQHHFATWPKDLAARAVMAVEKLLVLADTMAHCHALSPMAVIHRDLKPANIVIGKKGDYKITDFGIGDTTARQALEEARIATASGITGSTAGMVRCFNTPMYASPDQKKGFDPHPADDVHALGVMLYQFVQGNISLELGIDMWNDLESQRVCRQLLEVLDRSVASRAERRYPHAGELADALRSLPTKLIAERQTVSLAAHDKGLTAEIDAKYADADAKNAVARRQFDRREWAAAASTLESVFHPRMRDADLYARAVAFRDGKRLVNALGMEFALVPKGTFWMGGQDGNCGDKQVTIERDFYMGVYPVTQGEWEAVMGANPSSFRKGGSNAAKVADIPAADLKRFPVESVSWNDCRTFVQKLNEKLKESGYKYRLPTEAEWEYACRGAATTPEGCAWNFYFAVPTNALTPQQANFSDSGFGRPCRVGLYEPNALGLFDMHGNVWEWCHDWHDGEQKHRVLRGVAWDIDGANCRAASRSWYDPALANINVGLRLVRSVDR